MLSVWQFHNLVLILERSIITLSEFKFLDAIIKLLLIPYSRLRTYKLSMFYTIVNDQLTFYCSRVAFCTRIF